jgi:hypothetical protein
VETIYWDHVCAFIMGFFDCGDTVIVERYCGTLRGHSCLLGSKTTICAVTPRLIPIRPDLRLTMALELGGFVSPALYCRSQAE